MLIEQNIEFELRGPGPPKSLNNTSHADGIWHEIMELTVVPKLRF